VVIRIRRKRAPEPWRLGSLAGWSLTSLAGDPILLLLPLFSLVALLLIVLSLGLAATPDIVVPLVSLPPLDAFQDVGVIDLGNHGTAATWAMRVAALLIRTIVFGVLVRLAVQRARGRESDAGDAARFVRRRFRTLGFLELTSFALFGVTLALSANPASLRDDGAIGTALLFGVLILVNAFCAAAADEAPAGAALRRGFRWMRRRPLGHIALVLLYGLATNGLFRLATVGEPLAGRALPMTLYAFLSSLVTMVFVLAFARRYLSLYAEERATVAAVPRPD
jgi:hypothetical protein